jgi:hypothetical protein
MMAIVRPIDHKTLTDGDVIARGRRENKQVEQPLATTDSTKELEMPTLTTLAANTADTANKDTVWG